MVPSLFNIVGLRPEAVGPLPLLSTPLRKNCWAYVDAVWHRKSTDMALCAGEEIIFLATTVPLLLSDNNNRGGFCQVAFPHISESTERAKLLLAPVDASLKVAYSKVSSVFS